MVRVQDNAEQRLPLYVLLSSAYACGNSATMREPFSFCLGHASFSSDTPVWWWIGIRVEWATIAPFIFLVCLFLLLLCDSTAFVCRLLREREARVPPSLLGACVCVCGEALCCLIRNDPPSCSNININWSTFVIAPIFTHKPLSTHAHTYTEAQWHPPPPTSLAPIATARVACASSR